MAKEGTESNSQSPLSIEGLDEIMAEALDSAVEAESTPIKVKPRPEPEPEPEEDETEPGETEQEPGGTDSDPAEVVLSDEDNRLLSRLHVSDEDVEKIKAMPDDARKIVLDSHRRMAAANDKRWSQMPPRRREADVRDKGRESDPDRDAEKLRDELRKRLSPDQDVVDELSKALGLDSSDPLRKAFDHLAHKNAEASLKREQFYRDSEVAARERRDADTAARIEAALAQTRKEMSKIVPSLDKGDDEWANISNDPRVKSAFVALVEDGMDISEAVREAVGDRVKSKYFDQWVENRQRATKESKQRALKGTPTRSSTGAKAPTHVPKQSGLSIDQLMKQTWEEMKA